MDSICNELLFDKVTELHDNADISDLRKAFVAQQALSVSPAAVKVSETENSKKTLQPDQKLSDYFVPVSDSKAAAGPGRSKDSALFCTLPSPPPPPPDIERLLPLISVLPAVIKEVGISRKTRLNPWARESLRTSGSKRSKRFREKVIEYYKRGSNSGGKVKCQILDGYIFNADAEDEATGIIAVHIWKASTRGLGLQDFGLPPQEVNSARNGLFLTKGLEEAFDHMQICFLFNLIESRIVVWVADTSLMNKTIAGSGKTTADGSDILFSAVHQKPLHCPPNCFPYRRLLSWHARLTLELRPQSIDTNRFASEYDNSLGREKEAIDPFTRAVHEMVEPGDDASN